MKTTITVAALLISAFASVAMAEPRDAMMIRNPQLIRPNLGSVTMQSEYLGLVIESHNGQGLKVLHTVPGGAAETVGLEQGDLVIGAEGFYINSLSELESAMRTSFGSITVTVKDVRSGRVVNATMTLGRNGGGVIGTAVGYDPELGVGIEMMFGGRNKISSIENGSIAQKLGLTVGDILVSKEKTGSKVTVVYDDVETGRRYTAWYNSWGRN
ncbi:MAG: PDZ domain-containing protein [Planctomycetales bacterium]|nr:PDZ domain-containing protein [Planctomycetales bacterium]